MVQLAETIEQRHARMHAETSVAQKVASADQAASFGLYEYSQVSADQFRPFGEPKTVHWTVEPGEFNYLTPEQMYNGDRSYERQVCPPGTELHIAPSVTCFRVFGFRLPDGRYYLLTGT